MKLSGSWPVACIHCSKSMPWAWNCWIVPCTRWFRSDGDHGSGTSISTSSASASFSFVPACWRASLSLLSASDSRRLAVHASTESNSPTFSSTHSSVSSGSSRDCTDWTVTLKSAASSVPFGVEVNSTTSPADAPTRCSSKSSVTQPWPISYDQSSVFSPATSSPSRLAVEIDQHEVAFGGGTVDGVE